MECEIALQNIDRYLKNEITGAELVDFAEHIDECPACHDELCFYYIINRVTHELDTDDNINYDYNIDLDEEITGILEAGRKKSVKRFRMKLLINIAIVILTVVLVILFA